MIGYFYQCRYALLECLRRLPGMQEFTVSLEMLDDIHFETEGEPIELLQTKHHLERVANLTDASPDLWKTIRIWSEGLANSTIPEGSLLFLITTANAAQGAVAHYLKAGPSRDPDRALERLSATAQTSTNVDNRPAYAVFLRLTPEQKATLVNAITVLDAAPTIDDLEEALKVAIFYAVESRYLEQYLQRLEGWWYRRAIKQVANRGLNPILSEELQAETDRLREQFKQDNLPIDDEIMSASVDASGYQDRVFVHQLRLIEIGNPRILLAIRNYFRAFEQRSRWLREDLLLVGELDRYEERLIEEWDIHFQQMRDELGQGAAEEARKSAAQALYRWVETGSHRSIRSGVTEPIIARGTYHMLADNQRVGWHPDFVELLRQLIEPQEEDH